VATTTAAATSAAAEATRTGSAAAEAAGSPARGSRFRRGGVHVENFGDLTALLALAHAHGELGAGRNAFLASRFKRAGVQEDVAGAVGQFDESETLLRVEPLHGRINRRSGRGRRAEAAARRGKCALPSPKTTVTRRCKVVIKSATARLSEVSVTAHVYFR
jgi:hypothetical protein